MKKTLQKNASAVILAITSLSLAAQSPIMVKDILPGSDPSLDQSYCTTFGTDVYFSADDGTNCYELWKSDGTVAGTVMVKDIDPSGCSSPSSFIAFGSDLFFAADDGVNGRELWKTDGTTAGTFMVKDIQPGLSGSSPYYFIVFNSNLFFVANDGINGYELWKTDGTAAGTVLVKDLNLGASTSSPANLTIFNSNLFFAANDGINGTELWKTDGTNLGTVLVKDLKPGASGSFPGSLTVFNSELYFTADEGLFGNELYKTDGNSTGTGLMANIFPGSGSSNIAYLKVLNALLYFGADDGVNGFELWKTDGNSTTEMVKDINPGASSSDILGFAVLEPHIYFYANDGTNGPELWKSNGNSAGTVMVKDINPGLLLGSYPYNFRTIGTKVFFTADNGTNGRELWKTDGTTSGTGMVGDIYSGAGGSYPSYFALAGSTLFFQAENSTEGIELWKLAVCIAPPPPANTTTAANLILCAGASTTLSASGSGTLGWYNAASGGTYLGVGSNFTTPVLSTSTTYYVQDSACDPSTRTAITVTVNPTPFVNLGTVNQFASSVIAYSSQYSAPNWAAAQALGVPNTYPAYGDINTAWASLAGDSQREFLELGFTTPQPVSTIKIYETYNPGAIDTVYLRDASTGVWNSIYATTASVGTAIANILTINIATTLYNVDAIRIAVNSPAVPGWNEIDAVSIETLVNTSCGGTILLDAGNAGSTYLWSTSATNQSINVSTSDTYSVVVTNSYACSSSATINITIIPPPTVTANASATTVCIGTAVTLTGSGATTYSWAGGVTDGTSFTPSATATYTVTGTTSGCSNTATVEVTVNNPSTGSQTFTECAGFSVIVGANTYTSTGIYTDVLTAANGCDSAVTTNLTINTVDYTTTTSANVISANASGATYQWVDCNNANSAIAGETNQSYTASANGDYAVIVTENGCVDTSNCVNINTTGIEASNAQTSITIYPNPVINGNINIEINNLEAGYYSIVLYNALGKQVFNKSFEATNTNTNVSKIQINEQLAKGIYFVNVKSVNGTVINRKLVVQ